MKKVLLFAAVTVCYISSYAQKVGVNVPVPVEELDVNGAIRIGVAANANPGTIEYNGTDFRGRTGSGWVSLTAPGGITSLNGLTGAIQTLTTGSAGTAPAFTPSGTVHTLNIPLAATSGVTAGLLSNTQYNTFLNGLLPSGTSAQTLRHDGTNWVANSILRNNGTTIGINTDPLSGVELKINGSNSNSNSLQVGSGNTQNTSTSNQLLLAYNGTNDYRHAIKSRHNNSGTVGNAIDFYVWDHATQSGTPTAIGSLQVMTVSGSNGGRVGIGTNTPGATLDVEGTVQIAGGSPATGKVLTATDADGNATWQLPGGPTATYGEDVVTSMNAISSTSWTSYASVTLPGAGTYRVFYTAQANSKNGRYIGVRLYNVTTSTAITNSETYPSYSLSATDTDGSSSSESFITVTGSTTIALQAHLVDAGTGGTVYLIGNSNAKSKITYVKISN